MSFNNQTTPFAKIVAVHNIETVDFDYQITFGRFSKRIDTTYNTSIFTPPGRQEPQLYLHLDTQHNSVRVLLCVESSKKAVNCKTTSWFVTMDETKWQEKENTFSLNQNKNYELIKVPRAEVTTEAYGLLPKDSLTFYCKFTLDLEDSTEKLTTYAVTSKLDDPEEFSEDLEKLLLHKAFSDFEFTIGQRKFKVHKNILSTRSPVFRAMFTSDMEEKHAKTIPLTDIEPKIFEQLLKYIYTNRIPNLESMSFVIGLLIAADKYQLESLKSICEKALVSKLDVESMFNLLMVGDVYNASHLKMKAMEFISSQASSQDILKALFTNQLFGSSQSKTLMDAIRDLVK